MNNNTWKVYGLISGNDFVHMSESSNFEFENSEDIRSEKLKTELSRKIYF